MFKNEVAKHVKAIAFICDCSALDIVNALIGVAFDEEQAASIKAVLLPEAYTTIGED